MADTVRQLINRLSDGRFHSGTELGEGLQISRAAVWKHINRMSALGLEIHSVRGKGYRLAFPLIPLDPIRLNAGFAAETEARIQHQEILETIDSTNSYAMRQLQEARLMPGPGLYSLFLAEQQVQGKGRRGRQWVSPYGQNIYLTLVRQIDAGAMSTDGISLVVGLAVVRALKTLGIRKSGVKWPNDVLCNGKKLAGILLEITGDIAGVCQLLIGIGINVNSRPDSMAGIEQPWTDLHSETGTMIDRNILAAAVISHIMTALDEFQSHGFMAFAEEWQASDVMHGKQVELITTGGNTIGKAVGVAENGALLLETEEGIQHVNGGEISLRSVVSG